ncbi:hypothetical protein N0V95_001826 [Ascochyta clinopodiicola]|nr:hypothetical protein N0V95_001826 [Ascochyta clinopodiicola]
MTDRKRASTPPPSAETEKRFFLAPPSTPGSRQDALPRTVIPPSPGHPVFQVPVATSTPPDRLRASAAKRKHSQKSGVKKATPREGKTKVTVIELQDSVVGDRKATSLMDLPGELRNLIYSFTSSSSRQALLVHRPRIASLRSSTRLDRQRTLPSDIADKKYDDALPVAIRHGSARASRRKTQPALLARETNRPFFGLTQVCRLLRHEFRPLYMLKQEIGMDMVDVVTYLHTFYSTAPAMLKSLATANERKLDMPFTGNLTIAVGEKLKSVEKSAEGVDVWPLLDLWANSYKIEAGFGRYMQLEYNATSDGEAKDLYRLFGRRVQPDRRCSAMNTVWRAILRTRSLAAVEVHRKPASPPSTSPPSLASIPIPIALGPRPYIHIIFRREAAEAWMIDDVTVIPDGWLKARGFGTMEYFEVKVGVAPASSA